MKKIKIESDGMEAEFQQTRAFLRKCMASVVTGEINHQAAKDIAMLAQAQNYNMALESTILPRGNNGSVSPLLLDAASALVLAG